MSLARIRKGDYERPTFEELKNVFLEAEAKITNKKEQEADTISENTQAKIDEKPLQANENIENTDKPDKGEKNKLSIKVEVNVNKNLKNENNKQAGQKIVNQPTEETQTLSIEERLEKRAKAMSKYNNLLQRFWDAQQPNKEPKPRGYNTNIFNSEPEAMRKFLNNSIELLEKGYVEEALNLLIKMRDGGYRLIEIDL